MEVGARRLGTLVDELCIALAAFDPSLSPGDECGILAEALARATNACQATGARAAARAIECGITGAASDASAWEWLARVGGTTTGAARAALAAVAQVDNCPDTRAALVAGDVSLAQAAQIASVPSCEGELLDLARSSGLGAVRDRARKRRSEAIDAEELHARQRAARSFSHGRDDLGMVWFRGALPPDVGIPFVNRVDAETDRQWRAARREGRQESHAALAADAFVAVSDASGGTAPRRRSIEMVVVADLNAYRRGHAHEGEVCQIIGGGPIPVSLARELERDAFLKVALHDGVNVRTVAHFGRYRPAQLETALLLGAPPEFEGVTCTDEGCDRRYGLEWDHSDPRANGGVTSLANLKPKCKPHHWDKTERDRKAGLLGNRGRARAP